MPYFSSSFLVAQIRGHGHSSPLRTRYGFSTKEGQQRDGNIVPMQYRTSGTFFQRQAYRIGGLSSDVSQGDDRHFGSGNISANECASCRGDWKGWKLNPDPKPQLGVRARNSLRTTRKVLADPNLARVSIVASSTWFAALSQLRPLSPAILRRWASIFYWRSS